MSATSQPTLTKQVMHVVGQVASVMLDVHVQSLGVERRGGASCLPPVANGVRRVHDVYTPLDTATPGWLVARAIAEITGFVHVQPQAIHRQFLQEG